MFKITDGKGFHVTFKNGYTVSVQWGVYSYSDNHHSEFYINNEQMSFDTLQKLLGSKGSKTAETAIINRQADKDNFISYKGEVVQSYQTPEEVLETLIYAASL